MDDNDTTRNIVSEVMIDSIVSTLFITVMKQEGYDDLQIMQVVENIDSLSKATAEFVKTYVTASVELSPTTFTKYAFKGALHKAEHMYHYFVYTRGYSEDIAAQKTLTYIGELYGIVDIEDYGISPEDIAYMKDLIIKAGARDKDVP